MSAALVLADTLRRGRTADVLMDDDRLITVHTFEDVEKIDAEPAAVFVPSYPGPPD